MSLTILDLREAREAASPSIFYGADEQGFRRISQAVSARDLTPPMHERMQQVSYYLYVTNPLARRTVELLKDYVVGEGVEIKAAGDPALRDAAVQQVLDEFWNDPVNNLDLNLESYVRELSIFGEQLWCCATNPISGAVRIAYVDPAHIEAVEYATLESLPGRAVAVPIAVTLKKQSPKSPASPLAGGQVSSPRLGGPETWDSPRRGPGTWDSERTRLEVVHLDEDPGSPTFGRLRGECFYWAINKARAASRGISDLFAAADWVDGYDQMLFALMNHMDALSRFIWDVRLEGMTGEQIRDWLKENGTPPRPNSIRAHNEKVSWQAVAPPVQAADRSEGVRLIKNFILGGMGFPEHWFADGSTTNRATALVQGEPTLKMLTSRQRFIRYMLVQVLRYVIDQRIAAGVLPPDVSRAVRVVTPELSVRDLEKAAGALRSTADGLVALQKAAIVDEETMAQAAAAVLSQLGVQMDPIEALRKAKGKA